MENQVTNGFNRMNCGDLLVQASFIKSSMEANVNYFPAPDPSLAIVQTAIDNLQTAVVAAANMDRVAIAFRNEKKDELVALLRKLGVYVNLKADSNLTIARSSGFPVAKVPQPSPAITFVETPVVSLGVNAGELDVKVASVISAKVYHYLISTDSQLPVTQWRTFPCTKIKYSFTGLESAVRYYIRVAAIGINEQLVYSDVASFVTQ